jgi:hypothetical protein
VTAVRAAAAVALATALFASAATARPRPHRGPFVTAAMTAFLRTRAGNITAAVYNEGSGRLFLYRPGVAEAEASVAKVDILPRCSMRASGWARPSVSPSGSWRPPRSRTATTGTTSCCGTRRAATRRSARSTPGPE